MSKRVLELIKSLDFVDRKGRPANLMRMADDDLGKAMEHYFSVRLAEAESERKREAAQSGVAAMMTSTSASKHETGTLFQLALVYEKVFMDDPILHEVGGPHRYQLDPESSALKMAGLDRRSIAKKIQQVIDLAPLIDNGIVSLLPISLHHQAEKDIPILFSPDNFNSDIPAHIRSFVQESARISKVIRTEKGMLIVRDSPDGPVRTIAVHFEQDEFQRPGKIFTLSQITPTRHEEGRIYFEQDLDPTIPVSKEEYAAWLQNATNVAVMTRLNDASHEMTLATILNASYLTDSAFEAQVLALSAQKDLPADSRVTGVNFLEANTQFLNLQSAAQIAGVRMDNPLLFEKFQAAMLHTTSELTGVNEGFDDKARRAVCEGNRTAGPGRERTVIENEDSEPGQRAGSHVGIQPGIV